MRKIRHVFIGFFCVMGWMVSWPCAWAQNAKPAERGSYYENLKFPRPALPNGVEYLGLQGDDKKFALSEVNAQILILEVFSISCHYCQKTARHMNELYQMIEAKGLSDKIKIIGFGMPDTEFEISVYQRKFQVPFALIADADSLMYRIVGRVKIPCVVVLQRGEDGFLREVSRKERERRPAEEILKEIQEKTGLGETP